MCEAWKCGVTAPYSQHTCQHEKTIWINHLEEGVDASLRQAVIQAPKPSGWSDVCTAQSLK